MEISKAQKKLNHIDSKSNPTMVDVGAKDKTQREAMAETRVRLPREIAEQITSQGELNLKKGPVIHTAIIAGTMAVKNTANLIPFCHPLAIESAKIDIQLESENILRVSCSVKVAGKTGVEMEALTGATVAALTIYDMCKALSHEMEIVSTRLVGKSGGKRNIKEGKECG